MLVLVGKQGNLLQVLDTSDNTIDIVAYSFIQRSKVFVLGCDSGKPVVLSSVEEFWRYYAKYFFDTKGVREYMLGNNKTTYPYLPTNVDGLILRPVMLRNQEINPEGFIPYDTVASTGFFATHVHVECVKPVTVKDAVLVVPPFMVEFDTMSTLFEDAKYSYVRKVMLPKTVKMIKGSAFGLFSNLETVVIANPNCSFEDGAFSQSGLQYIELPENLERLPYSCFQDCSRLTSIHIPKSLTEIESCVFQGCNLLNDVSFENGSKCNTIGQYSFYGTAIEKFVCPKSVKVISDFAFGECSNLKRVELSENVTTIGFNAFSGCVNLTELVLPKTIRFVAYNAFQHSGIQRVVLKGKSAYVKSLPKALEKLHIKCIFED